MLGALYFGQAYFGQDSASQARSVCVWKLPVKVINRPVDQDGDLKFQADGDSVVLHVEQEA